MAHVTIFEVDGKEYSEREVKVRVQTRCDDCGEFVADKDTANITVTVYGPGIPTTTKGAQAHRAHVISAASDLAAELLAELGQ